MGGLFHKLRHPRRCYVVCTIPRSGSNLLTDGLRATRQAGMPKQFFLPKSEGRYGAELGVDPNTDYPGYVRGIVNTKTTRNEVFGFKLMSWYLDDYLVQTGLWKVQEGKTAVREPQFDAELIEQSLREAERQEKIWHTFFQRIGIDPFQVEYEALCRDYEATIRGVLDFLKISVPRGARIGPPVTVRQADEISRIWEERYLTERPSAYLPAHG
jgi:LPS sulfotransferase NodH